MLDESMFEDIHEIAENSAYLKAVEEKELSREMYDELPPTYEDPRCQDIEGKLQSEGKLTFDEIFNEPMGFYMVKCFLIADYCVDKAIFIKDVRAYKSMRFESARRKVALLLYNRFVATDEQVTMEYESGSSVFDIIRQKGTGDEKKQLPMGNNLNGTGGGINGSINAGMSPGNNNSMAGGGGVNGLSASPADPMGLSPMKSAPMNESKLDAKDKDKAIVSSNVPSHSALTTQMVNAQVGTNGNSSHSGSIASSNPLLGATANGGAQNGVPSPFQTGNQNNPIGVYGKSIRLIKEKVSAGQAPKDLFDDVYQQVLMDLKLDAFPRFRKSEFFKRYIRTKWIESKPVTVKDFNTFRVLGRGGFGAVHACRKRNSGAIYAMKAINKKLVKVKSALDNVLEERNVLVLMKSEFVTNIKYALQDEETLYLVMDLMLGGDLKFHLINAGRFTEKRAKFYAAQVLLGLEHVHCVDRDTLVRYKPPSSQGEGPWIPMKAGEVQQGGYLQDITGNATMVTKAVTPRMPTRLYEVTMASCVDGTPFTLKCTPDHDLVFRWSKDPTIMLQPLCEEGVTRVVLESYDRDTMEPRYTTCLCSGGIYTRNEYLSLMNIHNGETTNTTVMDATDDMDIDTPLTDTTPSFPDLLDAIQWCYDTLDQSPDVHLVKDSIVKIKAETIANDQGKFQRLLGASLVPVIVDPSISSPHPSTNGINTSSIDVTGIPPNGYPHNKNTPITPAHIQHFNDNNVNVTLWDPPTGEYTKKNPSDNYWREIQPNDVIQSFILLTNSPPAQSPTYQRIAALLSELPADEARCVAVMNMTSLPSTNSFPLHRPAFKDSVKRSIDIIDSVAPSFVFVCGGVKGEKAFRQNVSTKEVQINEYGMELHHTTVKNSSPSSSQWITQYMNTPTSNSGIQQLQKALVSGYLYQSQGNLSGLPAVLDHPTPSSSPLPAPTPIVTHQMVYKWISIVMERGLSQYTALEVASIYHTFSLWCGMVTGNCKSIIYRDMKLENVLLDHAGNSKISDLGLAVVTKVKIKGYAGTPGYCFPSVDHQIFTRNGFMFLDDVLSHFADHSTLDVACWVDGEIQYHPITRDKVTIEQGTPVDLIQFSNKAADVDVVATAPHRMFGRLYDAADNDGTSTRQIHTARDVFESGFDSPDMTFEVPNTFSGGYSGGRETPAFVKTLGFANDDEIDAFLWLYGYWMSNGSSNSCIEIGPVNSQDCAALDAVFARLPLPQYAGIEIGRPGWCKDENPDTNGQVNYHITSSAWLDCFAHQSTQKYVEPTSSAKSYSEWVWTLSGTRMRVVLAGQRFAVGDQSNGGVYGSIFTPSVAQRDEILRACYHAGYSARFQLCQPAGHKFDQWGVTFTGDSIHQDTPFVTRRDVSIQQGVDAKVWCVSVPAKDNLIMVRKVHQREGTTVLEASRAIIAGNTAPEMIKNKLYGPAADIFSYGVMLYRMLCGSKPFKGKVDRDLDKAVIEKKPQFPKEIFSKDATSLLTSLLQKRPELRLGCGEKGIDDIKEHPFFETIDWGLLEAGYIDPPFVPNKFDVNAASLKDIGDFDRAKYKHVKLDDRFKQRIKNFEYVSPQALQDEMVQVLLKVDENVKFEKFAPKAQVSKEAQPQTNNPCCVIL